ncbi:hypothetical protein GCM10009865_54250 [Aeromicrobium ponti]|uniref:Uncharacterized protein n=1 Tax=Cytobacillus oceanisediminis TaxID=665099 RepID=A0A562J3V4_9BACI|nr:hypothetical protein IQ19_05546 [Cytobacillus oceanisediminis]
MKFYWFLMFFLFFIWIIVSYLYPEPSWWSIFTSDRSTHTPLFEQISLNKINSITLILLGLAYLLHRIIHKHN